MQLFFVNAHYTVEEAQVQNAILKTWDSRAEYSALHSSTLEESLPIQVVGLSQLL